MDASGDLTREQRVFTLWGALLGLFLAALDQTVVATAGPAIQQDLAIEPSMYAWITTSYLVASTMMVPVWGKLSDLFGRKRVLLAGIFVFLAGSLACGLSLSSWQLIAARALQGLGAAALFTSAFAVVADLFPPAVRGRYTGLFAGVFGLSSVVGPLIGGSLTDLLSWHWVFFVNLPIGAVAVGFIATKMPRLSRAGPRPRVDIAGAAALAVFVVPLLLALSLGGSAPSPGRTGLAWASWQVVSLFALSAVGLAAFVLIEKRAAEPLLDPELFKNRTFSVGVLATFVLGAAFLASFVFLPLFMVNVVGLSATKTGLTTVPLTLGVVLGNIAAGQLVSRFGRYRPLMLVSLIALMGAFAIMGFTLTPSSGMGEVTWKMTLVGLGMGPSLPLYTLAVQNSLPTRHIGVATAAATFFRQMGSAVGVAVVGTLFAGTLAAQTHARLDAATRDLPPAQQAQLAPPPNPHRLTFDSEAAKAKVRTRYEAQRSLLTRVVARRDPQARAALLASPLLDPGVRELLRGGDPTELALPRALFALEAGEQQALKAVDRVDEALKAAFTDAIGRIYRMGVFVALLGFLLTLLLPEVPLRKSNAAEPEAVAEAP